MKDNQFDMRGFRNSSYHSYPCFASATRKDLSMEEKGSGVYNYFKTKGITLTPKELAKEVMRIEKKKSRNVALKATEKNF